MESGEWRVETLRPGPGVGGKGGGAVGVHHHAEPLECLFQCVEKWLPIGGVELDVAPLVASGGHMVDGIFKLNSNRSCHGRIRPRLLSICQESRVDPQSPDRVPQTMLDIFS